MRFNWCASSLLFLVWLSSNGYCESDEYPHLDAIDPNSIKVPILWDQWVRNQKGLRELPPVGIKATVAGVFVKNQGVEKKIESVHSAPGGYLIAEGENVPAEGESLRDPLARYYVAIDTADSYSYLNRNETSERWSIGYVSPQPRDPVPRTYFNWFESSPVAVKFHDQPIDSLCSYEIESRTASSVIVKFTPLNKDIQQLEGPREGGIMKHMHVTFEKFAHWLPTRVERYNVIANEDKTLEGYGVLMMSDYVPIGETWVPKKMVAGGDGDRNWKGGKGTATEIEIESIEIVPEDEVIKRASLEFWNLPSQRTSSILSYRLIAIVLLIAISAFAYLGYKMKAAR